MTAGILWVAAFALVLLGLAGTVLPALPGPVLVFVGLVLGAWAGGFEDVGMWTLGILALLTAFAYGIDFIASAMGTKRMGASPRAFWGATLGAIVGIFFGIPGLLLGPFLGAVAGELTVQRNLHQAGRAGVGAWLGIVIGTALKLALVFLMVGIFALAQFL